MSDVWLNDSVRVVAAPFCQLCKGEGKVLYTELRDRMFDAPGTWGLRECRSCKAVWLDPHPVAEDIPKLYAGDYATHLEDPGSAISGAETSTPRGSQRRKLRNAIVVEAYGHSHSSQDGPRRPLARLLSLVGPLREIAGRFVMFLKPKQRGRLLDVGCGSGGLLYVMQNLGWEVVGIDPDPGAIEAAARRGFEVSRATLEEAAFPDGSFDVITMSHVIEHVPDPEATLKESLRVLRPGGWLSIATPNAKSLGRRRFGRDWLGWSIPYHLLVFTPRTLRDAITRSGFLIENLRTVACVAGVTHFWSGRLRKGGPLPRMHLTLSRGLSPRAIPFWLLEYALEKVGPFGEEIIVIARKPAPAS